MRSPSPPSIKVALPALPLPRFSMQHGETFWCEESPAALWGAERSTSGAGPEWAERVTSTVGNHANNALLRWRTTLGGASFVEHGHGGGIALLGARRCGTSAVERQQTSRQKSQQKAGPLSALRHIAHEVQTVVGWSWSSTVKLVRSSEVFTRRQARSKLSANCTMARCSPWQCGLPGFAA